MATPMKVANTIVARRLLHPLRRAHGRSKKDSCERGRVRFKIQQVVRLTVTMLPNVLAFAIVSARKRDRSSTRGDLRRQQRQRWETYESQNEFGSAPGYISAKRSERSLWTLQARYRRARACVRVFLRVIRLYLNLSAIKTLRFREEHRGSLHHDQSVAAWSAIKIYTFFIYS